MNLTYVGWHIPKAYEFALSSKSRHNFEHFVFLAASLIFWWPVMQPWLARRRLNSWIVIPYLFTVPANYLTTRFLGNGRLVNGKTGLEAARAMAQ
jgi:cytochrome c oxidase assembly factor CtaG